MAVSVEGLPAPTANIQTAVATSKPESRIEPSKSTINDHKQEWTEFWEHPDADEHGQKGPSVALRELLEDLRWLLPKGRCLVAGCGNGQDAVYLAKRGITCIAIDFCDAAIARAQKLLESCDDLSAGKLTLAVQDFFTLSPPVRFTTAYEYGLFSAIHPSQRQRWAATYARLIVPQGTLIVLLCPLIHRGRAPPYRVSMIECERYLKNYFVLVRVDPNCKCIDGDEGNELITATVAPDEYNKIWFNCWNESRTMWDQGDISPALRELIQEKKWELPSGKGIVPGCGRGYDAMFLASPSLHMVGIDISQIAADTANKLRDEKGLPSSLVDFKVMDFFNFEVAEKYQVAYDYTFFCALHPSMRKSWGDRYAEIMAPGGHLIALMYPLWKEEKDRDVGPPFLLSEDDYHQILDDNFELIHIDPHCKTHETRAGHELITVWRRK
ncbi:hypothetical protein EV179_000072 [Coemansia sp. RSA 487]|nr:hypothetical protein EV179_000072 [Coemansia sp. RSA 487]